MEVIRVTKKPRLEPKAASNETKISNDICLDSVQKDAVAAVVDGQNVFLTGCAGTGKSFLLRHLTETILPKTRKCVYITASTGVAAVALGGTTLHSFAGVGLGDQPVDKLIEKVSKNYKAKMRWMFVDVLVIDEISMLDAIFLDKLEEVARAIRQREAPFGGIQLIFTGDFLQLPPVSRRSLVKDADALFAFESKTWQKCNLRVIQLTKVFRQDDPEFVELLRQVRLGICSEKTKKILMNAQKKAQNKEKTLSLSPTATPTRRKSSVTTATSETKPSTLKSIPIVATRLYSTKREVEGENKTELARLDSPSHDFFAVDAGSSSYKSLLGRSCTAPEKLSLKVGAQVVLLKNTDLKRGLCNGSRGVVTGFELEIDGGYPIVKFANDQILPVVPDIWQIKINGEVEASRTQVPLMLAWALTIHKCQGMTLDKVHLSLESVFEKGQAYVALSRCKNLEGLSLIGFKPRVIKAHPKAVAFYNPEDAERIVSLASKNMGSARISSKNPYKTSPT